MSTLQECLDLHQTIQDQATEIIEDMDLTTIQSAANNPEKYIKEFYSSNMIKISYDLAQKIAELNYEEYQEFFAISKMREFQATQENGRKLTERLFASSLSKFGM